MFLLLAGVAGELYLTIEKSPPANTIYRTANFPYLIAVSEPYCLRCHPS